jgi:hypothetical protein
MISQERARAAPKIHRRATIIRITANRDKASQSQQVATEQLARSESQRCEAGSWPLALSGHIARFSALVLKRVLLMFVVLLLSSKPYDDVPVPQHRGLTNKTKPSNTKRLLIGRDMLI